MMKQSEFPDTFTLLRFALHTQLSQTLHNPNSYYTALTTFTDQTTQPKHLKLSRFGVGICASSK